MFVIIFDLDEGGNGESEHVSHSAAWQAFAEIKARPDVRAATLWQEGEDEDWPLIEYARED